MRLSKGAWSRGACRQGRVSGSTEGKGWSAGTPNGHERKGAWNRHESEREFSEGGDGGRKKVVVLATSGTGPHRGGKIERE